MDSNIFKSAKNKPVVSKGKKTDIPVIILEEKKNEGFSAKVNNWASKKAEVLKSTAEIKELESEFLTVFTDNWIRTYEDSGTRPVSMRFGGESSDSMVLFTSADAYKKVDEEKAKTLKKIYGKQIIEEQESNSLDCLNCNYLCKSKDQEKHNKKV